MSLLVDGGNLSIKAAKKIGVLGRGGGAITIGQKDGVIEFDPKGDITISAGNVDINWHDLPEIESPFFAARLVEYGDPCGERIEGIDIFNWSSSLSRKDQLRKILEKVESGRIFLLRHTPDFPVFKWVKKGRDNGYWELNGSFGLSFDMHAQYMLRHIVRQHYLLQQQRYGQGNMPEECAVSVMTSQNTSIETNGPIAAVNQDYIGKQDSVEASSLEPATEEIKVVLTSVSKKFAPSTEKCRVTYKVKDGDVVAGSKAIITIKDASGMVVFQRDDLELKKNEELTFEWDGKANDGKYPTLGSGPFTVTVEQKGDPSSVSKQKQSKVDVVEIQLEVHDVDSKDRLIVNDPSLDVEVEATLLITKSDGIKTKTEIPAKVVFSYSDPAPANILHANTFQYEAGKKLGKQGDTSAIFWKAHPLFKTTSNDAYKTKCIVETNTTVGSPDLGKAKAYFRPSGVGGDTFKIKAHILAPDGTTELVPKQSDAFTIWRKIKYSNVYTMNGETYIDNATVHDQIGPAFESTGANGVYVLYERDAVNTLSEDLTVKYIGLYDAAKPNNTANWPADFSPAKLERFPNEMEPTAMEIIDYAYSGSDPVLIAKKAAAKTAIEAKASLWFNAVAADYRTRVSNWFSALALGGDNSLLAAQYYHPKLSNVGVDGKTDFWPAGISINLANPGSGLSTPGDPDQATWREVQGFNHGSISVIFKNYGTADRLQIVCRHEIGHSTKSTFKRAEFGVGDHSGSGLMTAGGSTNTFSHADAKKMRGEL